MAPTHAPRPQLDWYRREASIIFQGPFSSLDLRMTVLDIVGEPLRIHGLIDGDELRVRVRQLLQVVSLRLAVMYLGNIVETPPVDSLDAMPRNPYSGRYFRPSRSLIPTR